MADTTTANIGLLIADLNDTFNFGAHTEANFTTIDSMMGLVKCTSVTRPSNTYGGQGIYETDTLRVAVNSGTKGAPVWTYVSHAALAGTLAGRPTLGRTVGEQYYETDTLRLVVWNGAAWEQKAFASYVCTSATHPGSPFQGLQIYETDTGRTLIYNGSNYVSVGRMLMAAPQATASNGTPTSGITETFDTVLNYLTVANMVSGRRYMATVNGLIGNGSVAGDTFTIQIRDSQSSSNPTAGSALIDLSEWEVPAAGSAGRDTIEVGLSFLCTVTGTHVFGVSATRLSGTGVFTPVGTRELLIEDMGVSY